MLNNIDVKASLQGLVIISDDRLPVRRIPLRGKPVKRYLLPYRGLLGLILICVAWPFSWAESGTGLQYTFFPLWLGFILAVDGLVLRRTGTSLIVRSPKIMAMMFILAVPYWWMFEAINQVIQNWVYIGSNPETSLFSLIQTSLAFSVVIPAVFEVSELVGSFNFINRFARMPALVLNRQQVAIIGILGVLSLAALLTWPKYLFPITWLSLFFIFDPINYLTGRPSITANVRHGDWRLVVAFALGALICGFFWEMWNYQATISWQYNIGFFDFARIFHMPLLGYGGYLPFGLETYAMFHFVVGLLGWSRDANIPVRGDLGISAD
ncbi:MAG: hypothetical protein VX505_05225 [Chloroflexota bacterium]|nr:MAG: hypothetical protein EGP13_06850 [SAR202 cluster bacterium]MEE3013546.1 hypothetical protein [Chloroflexota bacterium]